MTKSPYMTKKRLPLVHKSVSGTLILIDIFSFLISFLASYGLLALFSYEGGTGGSSTLGLSYQTRLPIFFSFAACILIVFMSKGLYHQRVAWWSRIETVFKTLVVGLVMDGFMHFIFNIPVSPLLIITNWMLAFGFMIIAHQLAYTALRRRRLWQIPSVLIGDAASIHDALAAFEGHRYAGYDVHTVLLRDKPGRKVDIAHLPARYKNIKVIEDADNYEEFISAHRNSYFILAMDSFRGDAKDRVIGHLDTLHVQYAVIPGIKKTNLYEMEARYFFGHDIMLLHTRDRSLFSAGQFVKRVIDVSAAATGLVVLAPLFAIIALMLKLDGQGGSIFYGGERIGRYGRSFRCWKFRTMEPDSDHLLKALLEKDPAARASWKKYRKLTNDPRIVSRTARFLRKSSLDEIPQLFNVLTGEMSLVGPRPILPDEQELFGVHLEHYMSVRPGISGLWQVSGRNSASFAQRVHWDVWYVRNWSMRGDIIILLKTFKAVLGRSGAF